MGTNSQVHLFVLIDALGWTYIQDRDFLLDLLPHRRPLRTVLGFSSGAIPSILTGAPPSQTGHWNLFYYDPQNSPFRWLRYFSFLPDSIMEARVTRKLLKEMGRRVLGLGPLFECCVTPRLLRYFNWTEKRNIYATGGITGAPSIFDQLAAEGKRFHVYSYHNFSDAEAFRQAQRDLDDSGPGFYFVYLCEFDSVLHHHCTDNDKVESVLRFYANNIRDLFSTARKIDPDAALTVFSDHGMTPIHTHFDLVSQVEALGFSQPEDFLAVYDATMARFWFFNDETRRKVSDLLDASPSGRILSELELEALGIYFPDHRHGELVFLLHPGWLIGASGFNNQRWMPIGMHGYHPDDIYSDGIFLSSASPSVPVKTISDVHACMRAATESEQPCQAE